MHVSGLGLNITDMSVKRVGKCVGKTVEVLQGFDKANNIRQQSGYHTRRSSTEEVGHGIRHEAVIDFVSCDA